VSNSLSKVKSHNALLCMLLVCIQDYLKSVLRYKFLILDTYQLDTIYMSKDVITFWSQKVSVSKNTGKFCFDRMLGKHCCDNLDNTVNLCT